MTLLLYAERRGDRTFHDYITLTLTDAKPEVICGNVNVDEEVDIGDVVYLVNYLYVEGAEPLCQPIIVCGDVNLDGEVDVGDVIYLINYLFLDGPPPCEP